MYEVSLGFSVGPCDMWDSIVAGDHVLCFQVAGEGLRCLRSRYSLLSNRAKNPGINSLLSKASRSLAFSLPIVCYRTLVVW